MRPIEFEPIIGYGGYLAGVKSENVYGQTYGKTSFKSTAGTIERGIDLPAPVKYSSTFKAEFIKHSEKQHETIAQIVGVHREEDKYKKVSCSRNNGNLARASRRGLQVLRSRHRRG